MGMYDDVSAPPITCRCGATVDGWQSKDGHCDLVTIHPDEVDHYYSSCRACNTWHSFSRDPKRELRPFVHYVGGERQPHQDTTSDIERERDLLRKALEGMMESYDILMDDTPLGSHPVASGVIRAAFIGAIELSRAILKPNPSDQAR